jgi:hypothetical protein
VGWWPIGISEFIGVADTDAGTEAAAHVIAIIAMFQDSNRPDDFDVMMKRACVVESAANR